MHNGRITDEISRLVEITGHCASHDRVMVRAVLGRAGIPPRCNDCRMRSTDAGRRHGIQPLAAGRSAEADSKRGLNEREAQLLKIHLKRAMRKAEGPLPHAWCKKNCWRENNVRGGRNAALQFSLEGTQS
jgi:hypothetical protein